VLKLLFHAALASNGKPRSATVKMDPTKTPRTYDLLRDDGHRSLKGIYTWEGDKLKVCASDDNGDRPTEFKTEPGSKNRIRVWKRQPSGTDARTSPVGSR